MTAIDSNPLLQAWTTPFGLPPFAMIRPEHFEPAFAEALRSHRAEIAAIADETAPATFENTLRAFDRSGSALNRIEKVFFNLTASETSPALQAVERVMSPRLTAHYSAIYLDAALFARIDDLYRRRSELVLDAEQLQLLRRVHLDFERAGARLPKEARDRNSAIVERLATLSTRFSQNVLADEAKYRCRCRTSATWPACPRTYAPRHARRRSSAATVPAQ